MSPIASASPPTLSRYLLGGLIALLVLIPLWTLFVARVIQPESFIFNEEQSMNSTWVWPVVRWGVLLPVAVVTLGFGARWTMASKNAPAKQQAEVQQATASAQAKREYVLEVIGLGVTLDKYRQGKLWEALQAGSPYTTIREQDKKKYEWSAQDKDGLEGGRQGDTLENGAQSTPMYFGVPVFNAVAPIHNDGMADKPTSPRMGLAGSARVSGMAWHLFVTGSRRFEDRPDKILEDVFAFFDANPDLPYIVLNSHDGAGTRDENRPRGARRMLEDGYIIPEMPDASTLFVLARRERVDAVRPFAWDDPDNAFVQNIFRWMYYELVAAVPHPEREKIIRTPAQVGADPTRHEHLDAVQRQPLVSEWLEAAAAFAQRPDIRGTGVAGMLGDLNPFAHHPPKEWKPTPWFPIPWNKDQLATFDRLPTLGFIHRPTFVRFVDEQGKPLTRRDEREKALQTGWQAALQTLPEAQRTGAPVRIVAATGGNTDQMVALHATLAHIANGGPEIDSGKSSQFIDTDKRLGNTGATTLFMQMAIGVMGSYRDGGISAAVNLRDLNEASIVLISPPSDDKRRTQRHPNGGDVFAHHGTPAIDPNNYK
jgi:hypothetical protein